MRNYGIKPLNLSGGQNGGRHEDRYRVRIGEETAYAIAQLRQIAPDSVAIQHALDVVSIEFANRFSRQSREFDPAAFAAKADVHSVLEYNEGTDV